MESENKRPASDEENEDESDGWIGPMPSEAAPTKKRKVLHHEQVFLDNMPSSESYEKSYMHRDIVTHLVVTKTDFVITASCDGHVKFWKKSEDAGIEFVKHFRSHLGKVMDLSASYNGELACTVADDKTVKVFDVVNFDMINMFHIKFVPQCSCWIYSPGDAVAALAIGEKDSENIHIYDGRGEDKPIHLLDKLHYKPVTLIQYNAVFDTVVSVDTGGMIEYWSGTSNDYKFPKRVSWEYKVDTDLYEFAKDKAVATGMAFSPDGKLMATLGNDRKVRVFKFLTGKICKVLNESLKEFTDQHTAARQSKQPIPNMEFGRRMAVEKELAHTDSFNYCNILFDESGNFMLYATLLGVKVVNLVTNRCVKILGRPENARFLHMAMFQGTAKKAQAAVTLEIEASDNPLLHATLDDPTLFCTAYKKNRFYLFSRRNPHESAAETERDVFNEKPTKEEMVSATHDSSYQRVSEQAVLHTTMGDIHIKLFPKECPKTVENFCVHSRNGYYNSHIFHRVIKAFMIQTGDPLGNGTGGESIWGGEFEDEFHPSLKHDRPYTFSMANAGPNTNGSQFFITVGPTPWLDNKHTVFGRCSKGMEIIQSISNVAVNPKTDKPHEDIRIISVTVK